MIKESWKIKIFNIKENVQETEKEIEDFISSLDSNPKATPLIWDKLILHDHNGNLLIKFSICEKHIMMFYLLGENIDEKC